MDIKEKKDRTTKSKVLSSLKYIGVFFITFIISASIINSYREVIEPNEITQYETTLDEVTDEVVNIENNILTTQKEIEELEEFIRENSN